MTTKDTLVSACGYDWMIEANTTPLCTDPVGLIATLQKKVSGLEADCMNGIDEIARLESQVKLLREALQAGVAKLESLNEEHNHTCVMMEEALTSTEPKP